jgi:hypothetical protein
MGCIAAGYADEFEVKGHWHFANSDENRVRLASFWTATLFLIDCAANAWGVGLELGQLAQQPHDDLRWNPGFLFENSAEAESTSCQWGWPLPQRKLHSGSQIRRISRM